MRPGNVKAHNGKGNALYGLKDYVEAIKCSTYVQSLHPPPILNNAPLN